MVAQIYGRTVASLAPKNLPPAWQASASPPLAAREYMLLGLDDGDTLIVHLRMTVPTVEAAEEAPDAHTRTV
jgi:hypothetical protein